MRRGKTAAFQVQVQDCSLRSTKNQPLPRFPLLELPILFLFRQMQVSTCPKRKPFLLRSSRQPAAQI